MSSTKKSVKGKKSADEVRTICNFGRAGLTLAVMVWFSWIIAFIVNATSKNYGFGLLFGLSFVATMLFIVPLWLIVGIVCLVKSRKASEQDCAKLKLLGVLNVVNAAMTWFLVIGGAFACVVGLIYGLVILVWLIWSGKTANAATKSRGKKQELTRDQALYRVLVVMALVVVAIVLLFGLITTVSRWGA